jgi:ribosome-associated protein
LTSKKLTEKISELIFNKKGYNVLLIDLRGVTSFTDFFVIATADSDTQVKAIADEVDIKLKDEGIKCWHKEGYQGLNWVLLDYVDVVVHIFKREAREFYNLEKLWGDAPVVKVEDPDSENKPAVKSKSRRAGTKKIDSN